MEPRRTRFGRLLDAIEHYIGSKGNFTSFRTREDFEADTFGGKTLRNSEELNERHRKEFREQQRVEQAKHDEQAGPHSSPD